MKKLSILILLLSVQVSAQQIPVPTVSFSPPSYICYKTDGKINIDGFLDEKDWMQADWTEDFIDIEGPARPKPRFKTRAKMLWDTSYFYIAADLEEPDVWATLTQHDDVIFNDNDFEVFIDPDGDTHQYYEFEMNALNTFWELFLVQPYRDGGPAMNSWNIPGLKTAVNVRGTLNTPGDTDQGWTIELAFPWSVLKECAHRPTPPKGGDQWRVNFSRVEWKSEVSDGKYRKITDPSTGKPLPEDNWVWAPQGLINIHYPEMWGFVQFSENIAGAARDKFIFLIEEYLKWSLRQVYYAQRKYFAENKKYTDDSGLLAIKMRKIDGYSPEPRIFFTPNQFEAVIMSDDGKTGWHIDHKGRTWKQ